MLFNQKFVFMCILHSFYFLWKWIPVYNTMVIKSLFTNIINIWNIKIKTARSGIILRSIFSPFKVIFQIWRAFVIIDSVNMTKSQLMIGSSHASGARVLVPPWGLDRSFPDGAKKQLGLLLFLSLILLSLKSSYSYIRAHRHRSVNFDSLTYKHTCRCRCLQNLVR